MSSSECEALFCDFSKKWGIGDPYLVKVLAGIVDSGGSIIVFGRANTGKTAFVNDFIDKILNNNFEGIVLDEVCDVETTGQLYDCSMRNKESVIAVVRSLDEGPLQEYQLSDSLWGRLLFLSQDRLNFHVQLADRNTAIIYTNSVCLTDPVVDHSVRAIKIGGYMR